VSRFREIKRIKDYNREISNDIVPLLLERIEQYLNMERHDAINILKECREQLAAEREAAQAVCKIYFEIAAAVIGEDEVRRKRDAALAKIGEGK
jgi:hypothetical protein